MDWKIGRRSAVLGAMLVLFAAAQASAQAGPAADPAKLPPALADHHMHIQGPDISALLKAIYKRNPKFFEGIGPEIFDIHSGADAIRLLDEAGIKQGVLLSQGYSFASPFAAEEHPDIVAATRRENRYVVDAALASHGRLVAFISADPLADNALPEIAYWAGKPGVTGLKLHLGNAGFDPDSAADFAKLARVFDAARDAHLPIVIHLSSAKSFTPVQINRFIDEVLPHAGDLPVQIAHGAGGGGIDDDQLADLAAYGAAIKRGAPGTRNLVIDLAVVVLKPGEDPALGRRMVEEIRSIGPQRFVPASDWPAILTPKAHNALQESQIPLTDAEWRTILANKAPYLR
jgi:predicted TIM-barrel fold metal-dependent hydrolase